MKLDTKRTWTSPEVHRYGTFEDATKQSGCEKQLGASDGFTFEGQQIVCAS